MSKGLVVTALDDFHNHLRNKPMTQMVIPGVRRYGIVAPQPNTIPALDTPDSTIAYCRSAMNMAPSVVFMPVMRLTMQTTPDDIASAYDHGVRALKAYPASMTTNSDDGITDYRDVRLIECLEAMEEMSLPLMGHFTAPSENPWDEELAALETVDNLFGDFPDLPISFEHITTADGLRLLRKWIRRGRRGFGTATLHHALARLADAWDPNNWVKPSLQPDAHAEAVLDAILSGENIGFGSDSAPHLPQAKQMPSPASGIWTPCQIAYPLLVETFKDDSPLLWGERLTSFGSVNGRTFYGYRVDNTRRVRIQEVDWQVDIQGEYWKSIFEDCPVIPFWHGKTLHYRLAS